MMTEQEVESTESVRIDRVLLEVIREWAQTSGRTVAAQVREVLRPACAGYLEGKKAGIMELGNDLAGKKASGVTEECSAAVDRVRG